MIITYTVILSATHERGVRGSSYWIALTNVQDATHEKARSLAATLAPDAILTTEYVLTEYLNYFCGWGSNFRRKAAANVESMLLNRAVGVATHTPNLFLQGLNFYRERLDKSYSLTDCISMQIMRQQTLTDVLTTDRHFEQEGFRPLLRV